MKVGIIADQHIGVRNDSQFFSQFCIEYLRDDFIPRMKQNGIQHVFHLGDVFDRRKYINFKTLSDWRQNFFDILCENKITLHVIVGNHDVYYKNTNDVNSMQLLDSYPNIFVYDKPHLWENDGYKVFLCPWIPSGQEQQFIKELDQARSDICFGHFELMGFDMFKGHQSTHGLSEEVLKKFRIVLSGHYHHRSTKSNITYVGSPYGMTWSDFGDPRGYHIFDFNDRSLQFFENPKSMFIKFEYDDEHMSMNDLSNIDYNSFTNKYVKIIIKNKTNPYFLDKFLDNLYNKSPADVSIVDLVFQKKNEDVSVDVGKDTKSILVDYIKNLQLSNEGDIIDFMSKLYHEAINLKMQEGT
jgi:DNA repair exonuclease SbcCD nuclease subunit